MDFYKRQELMNDAEMFYNLGMMDIIPSLVDEAFEDSDEHHAWYLSNWHTDYTMYDIKFVEYVHQIWQNWFWEAFEQRILRK